MSTYKTVYWKVSFRWVRNSGGRRFTQFVGRSRHLSHNYVHYVQFYIFKRAQRPARRGSVSPHRGKFSRAPQHPKDTAGSTLAPISPDPLIKKKKRKERMTKDALGGDELSHHCLSPSRCGPVGDGMQFSLNSCAIWHFSSHVPLLPQQVHPRYALVSLSCPRSGFIRIIETKLPAWTRSSLGNVGSNQTLA